MLLRQVRIECSCTGRLYETKLLSFCRISTVIPLSPSFAARATLLGMTTEENIRALSRRVTDAPENSKEFRAVVDKLRANLKARAARERERVAALQRALPPSEDARGETLFGG